MQSKTFSARVVKVDSKDSEGTVELDLQSNEPGGYFARLVPAANAARCMGMTDQEKQKMGSLPARVTLRLSETALPCRLEECHVCVWFQDREGKWVEPGLQLDTGVSNQPEDSALTVGTQREIILEANKE